MFYLSWSLRTCPGPAQDLPAAAACVRREAAPLKYMQTANCRHQRPGFSTNVEMAVSFIGDSFALNIRQSILISIHNKATILPIHTLPGAKMSGLTISCQNFYPPTRALVVVDTGDWRDDYD